MTTVDDPSAVERDPLLFRPKTWFERLDLGAMFDRAAPLEVELGCGDGSFLIEWARRHPDRNYIGVERLLGRVRKVDRQGRRAGLTNVRGLRIEASYCLEYLLPVGGVETLHVYFPDPWPKRRHHKHRLVNARFVELTHQALRPDGLVHFRTDSPEYFAQMRAVFSGLTMFREVGTPAELSEISTDFERTFEAQGVPTQRASFARLDRRAAEPVSGSSMTLRSA